MSSSFITIENDSGSALCKTVVHEEDEYQLPVDYSFESINNYVHNMDRQYEELQYLALGMASHGDRLREQLAIATKALNHIAIKNAKDGQAKYAIARQALAQIRQLDELPTATAGTRRKFDHVVTNGEPIE